MSKPKMSMRCADSLELGISKIGIDYPVNNKDLSPMSHIPINKAIRYPHQKEPFKHGNVTASDLSSLMLLEKGKAKHKRNNSFRTDRQEVISQETMKKDLRVYSS